jgi:hypothetical protein
MDADKIRKQVYELTPSDLEEYPIWEFALDEEGVEGQDEATVRPLPDRKRAFNGDVARATFVTADGIRFTGYVTPDPDRTSGYLQPTIVTEDGQVNFWFGHQEAGVTEDMIEPLYDLLGKSADELFPVAYRLDVPWEGGTLDGEITGFGWMPEVGSDEVRERR